MNFAYKSQDNLKLCTMNSAECKHSNDTTLTEIGAQHTEKHRPVESPGKTESTGVSQFLGGVIGMLMFSTTQRAIFFPAY